MKHFEVATRTDGYDGIYAVVRTGQTELIIKVDGDNCLSIRSSDNCMVAEYRTNERGGERTLITANHDYLNVIKAQG